MKVTHTSVGKTASSNAVMGIIGDAIERVLEREQQRQRDFEEYLPAFQNVISRRQEMKSRGQDVNGGERED